MELTELIEEIIDLVLEHSTCEHSWTRDGIGKTYNSIERDVEDTCKEKLRALLQKTFSVRASAVEKAILLTPMDCTNPYKYMLNILDELGIPVNSSVEVRRCYACNKTTGEDWVRGKLGWRHLLCCTAPRE